MCLGIPMQLMTIDGDNGRGHAAGIERDINLFLLQHETLQCGDFVMVHVEAPDEAGHQGSRGGSRLRRSSSG